MKLSEFEQAKEVHTRLTNLDADIRHASGEGLGVTLQGRYQDNDFLEEVREAIVGVLLQRRQAIIDELRELGVYNI